jgi:predicted RNase H-like nuclease (RuvC/YqgF family)
MLKYKAKGSTMADEQATEVVEQVEAQATTTEQVESQEIDYKTEYEQSQASIEKLKADNAGLDRKIGELSKAQMELLKKTETAEETTAREREEQSKQAEQERNDFLNKQAEFSKKENDFNVKVKALELGFTAEEIESLKFTSIEHVESTKAYVDKIKESTASDQTKKIENALSGSRDKLNNSDSKSSPYSDILAGGLDS